MSEPALRLVSDTDQVPVIPWPETGEALTIDQALHRVRDLLDERDGLVVLTRRQAKDNAQIERKLIEEADPASHPRGQEIVDLVERWKRGVGHPKAKISADRVKLVKARIKDGYPLGSEEWLPTEATLELAIDGLCAHPYVVSGQRVPLGNPSQRHDRIGIALAGGEKVEEFARLGYKARRDGLVTWAEA